MLSILFLFQISKLCRKFQFLNFPSNKHHFLKFLHKHFPHMKNRPTIETVQLGSAVNFHQEEAIDFYPNYDQKNYILNQN